jgi:hypothetical protein
MKKTIRILRIGLTIFLLMMSVLAFAAGADIYNAGEPDLSAEWIVLSVFFFTSVFYVIINITEIIFLGK